MLFTIIIPVYNRAKVVQQTLDTVVAQTHRPLQVVLVDNASTDDSLQVLEQFRKQHDATDFQVVVAQEPHHTAGAARNRGLECATGEWLMFFDSDDEMEPGLVEAYAQLAEEREGNLDLISARSLLVFPDGTSREAPFFKRDIFANQILHSQLATQRYAVRREFFLATDGWNIDLPGWNDWELAMRLLLARPRIAFMDCPPLIRINHNGGDSITGTEFHTRAGQWERAVDIVQKEVRCSNLRDKRRYHRLIDYRRLVLAAQYHREGHPELAKPLAQNAFSSLRETYGNNVRWKWFVAPVTRWMFRRIVAGKRGSARIARRLF